MAVSDEKLGKIADASKTNFVENPYADYPAINKFGTFYEAKKT